MKRAIITIACIAVCLALVANAQIPQTLNYQGVLTDGSGVAVPDGSYSIEFNIYNIASEGTALWTETNTVQVTKGIFSVVLGTLTSLNLAFDESYWLGMAVEGEAELTPRVELTASAYSLNSQGVTGTDNVFPSSGNVGIGTTSPSQLLTIEGDPSKVVGLQYNGYNTDWNMIYVNSAEPLGRPGYGYYRTGIKAFSFVDQDDYWKLRVGAENVLFVTPGGDVGIRVLMPVEKLDVAGGIRLGSATGTNSGTIQWTGSDFEGYDGSAWQSLTGGANGSLPVGTAGQTLRHNGTDWEASSVLYNSGTRLGIGTTTPVKMLDVNGTIRAVDTLIAPVAELSKWFTSGELRIMASGMSGGALGLDAKIMTEGAQMRLWDEAGAVMHFLAPDSDGEGGHLSIMRDNLGRPGFMVDGNRNGTTDTYVQIAGSSTTIFDMSESDDNSVQLPDNAVSTPEILNETGVASDKGAANSMDPNVTELLADREISVPSSGYVLVIGTASIQIEHINGTESGAFFGVSDDPSMWPDNQVVVLDLNAALPSGLYSFPVTVHGLFEVSAADNIRYYFLGYEAVGGFRADEIQFTLVFIPTAYGIVAPTVMAIASDSPVPRARGASAGNAAERAESIAFDEARVERELAEMRARIAELEKAVENK